MALELVQQWLAALRSKKYSQAKGVLHDAGGYCCLGVLCDLVDPTQWRIIADSSGEQYRWKVHGGVLPESLMNELNLDTNSGRFPIPDEPGRIRDLCIKYRISDAQASSLSSLNDCGATFEEIAEVIEARPRGLFVD